MTSRKGSIIAIAERKSALILEAVPEERRRWRNLADVRRVCRALVERTKPIAPTAATVAEEGRNRNEQFPAAQTLHNAYSEMLSVWRKAHHDIMHIDALDPIPLDELDGVDVSGLDQGTRFIVEEMRQHIRELTQRCNALKEIIAETVPVPADDLSDASDRTIELLGEWLDWAANSPFDLDEIGFHVSRRVSPGTTIMDGELFNMLRTLVDDFRLGRRARGA